MCGIFGIVTKEEEQLGPILVEAGRRLSYRGYDSVGCATLHKNSGEITLRKDVGRVDEVAARLKKAGLRVIVDDSSDRMNAKIRNAQKQKVPYMLVIGDREMEEGQVALRRRSGENPGPMSVEAFLELALREIEEKI